MMRGNILRRLKDIEESLCAGVYIVVWHGLPPIYVSISRGSGQRATQELKLFDSMEEVSAFLEASYPGADALELTMGGEITSERFHSYAL